MRILLVDDSDTIEAYVRKAIDAEDGWALDRARGGMEAMTRVLAHRPDVILLDFAMPDMDGLEALKLFFAAEVRAPTIVLSGAENPDVMRRFAAAGAADYLAKEDMTPARLRQAIRMAADMGPAEPPRAKLVARPDALEALPDAPAIDPRGAVVLVVDDTESFRALLRKPLAARGWTVIEAHDAATGIASAIHMRPDVILLDHVLPDDEGLSVLRAVREAGLDARVVAFTGHGDEELAEAFLREGAVDHLSKDTSVARVERALERALWLGGVKVAVRPKP